jgi:glycogen operon protein
VLAREPAGFDNQNGFLKACNQDPVLRKVKLIAEPWDCGPGGYQVGGFPPGWAEWNDRYRDAVRDFWKGSAPARDIAPRLTASGDLFNVFGRRPSASVNFVTAHDGFTLHDLVSYNEKHNDANGEDNRDGSNDNRSWNCGAEGPSDDPDILALRNRQMRNFLATLLLSQGTPMLLAGDETLRSQSGNNNAYCQDNELSWVKWNPDERAATLTAFVRKLTQLRHRYPILRRNRFLTGDVDDELQIRDLTWMNANGGVMQEADWRDDRTLCFGMLMDGRARPTGLPQHGVEATMLLVLNGYHDLVEFVLPPDGPQAQWQLLIDTNLSQLEDLPCFAPGTVYGVTGRSLLLFVLRAGAAS